MDLFDDKPTKGKKIKEQKYQSGNAGNSSNSGKQKELVLKVVSNIKGANCKNSIDYITRNNEHKFDDKDFIPPENEMGDVLNREQVNKLSEEWKEEFSDPKKINTRNMTHLVLSVDIKPTKENQISLQNAARDFFAERFGDEGFRYTFVVHNDTDKPHVHILVNNNNLETQKKLRIDVNWHYESRLMAKEHLKNHGINQEATFKKDRQIMRDKEKSFEQSEALVNNWFEAKLKNSSHNDKHYEHMKRQFDVIQSIKSEMKQSDRFTTQQQVELSDRVKELRQDIALYDSFTNRTETNRAVHKLIKDINPPSKTLKESVGLANKKDLIRKAQQESKYKRQLYFQAKELVKAQSILDSSQVSSAEKRATNKLINERKKFLESKGIDVKKLELDQRVSLSDNDKFKGAYREANKVVSQTNKQVKKDGSLDHEAAQKRFVRLLDMSHTAESTNLSKDDKKALETAKSRAFIELESKGLPAKQIYTQWKEAREFKESIKSISHAVSEPLDKQQRNELQKQLLAQKEKLEKNRPSLISKKESYSLNINLNRSQQELDKQQTHSFADLKKQLDKLARGFKALDLKLKEQKPEQKQPSKQVVAQSYAMAASYTDIEQKIATGNFLPVQKETLKEQSAKIKQTFKDKGIDIEQYQAKLEKSNNLPFRVKQMEQTTMNRIRANGYDKSEASLKNLQNEIKDSQLTDVKRRELNKSVNAKKKEIGIAKKEDSASLADNLKRIKELDKQIKELQSPQLISGLSALEKLNNKRQIDQLSDKAHALIKSSKPLVQALPSAKNLEISTQLKLWEKKYSTNTMQRAR